MINKIIPSVSKRSIRKSNHLLVSVRVKETHRHEPSANKGRVTLCDDSRQLALLKSTSNYHQTQPSEITNMQNPQLSKAEALKRWEDYVDK